MRSASCSTPTSTNSSCGALVVELVVLLAPAADDAVRRRHDDVADQLVARDPLGEGGAGEPDPRPQLEDVDRAQHLVEDARDTRRRVDLGRRDLQQRRLAGTVGSEHDPALVLLDRPVDASSRVAPPRRTVTPANSRTADMAATLSTDARPTGAYPRAP